MAERIRTRFLVVGSGVAGLHTAWRASADASEQQHRLWRRTISSACTITYRVASVKHSASLGEFAYRRAGEILSAYLGLQPWSGTPVLVQH